MVHFLSDKTQKVLRGISKNLADRQFIIKNSIADRE